MFGSKPILRDLTWNCVFKLTPKFLVDMTLYIIHNTFRKLTHFDLTSP